MLEIFLQSLIIKLLIWLSAYLNFFVISLSLSMKPKVTCLKSEQ